MHSALFHDELLGRFKILCTRFGYNHKN